MLFRETVECQIILPIWHSTMLVGMHGTGKTESVRVAANLLGAGYHDERLSQSDVGDLKGMPFFINGRTVFAQPEWYPMRDEDAEALKEMLNLDKVSYGIKNPIGFLALEEVDRATRQVQQASFEIALDRRLNMRMLRPGWRVTSCINGDDEIYHVLDMDPAFIDRWVWFNFNPSVEEWLDHSKGKTIDLGIDFKKVDPEWLYNLEKEHKGKVHPAVLEFITRYPSLLDPTKELIEANPTKKLQSRRSWTRFSEAIYVIDAWRKAGYTERNLLGNNPTTEIPFLLQIASGYVGEVAAAQFTSFVRTDYKAMDADSIINKWSDKIKGRLAKMVEDNQTVELSRYNVLLVDYIEKNITELNMNQSKNLLEYVKTVSKEVRADFWVNFSQSQRETAMQWFRGPLKSEVSKALLDALSCPDTLRK